MKIVIGNYASPTDHRNLILNDKVVDRKTGDTLSPMFGLINKISGLDTAEFRNNSGNWSGIDGGYMSAQYYGARTITIEGVLIDRQSGCDFSAITSSQFDKSARLYVRSRLPIRTSLAIRIFLDNGMVFYTEGYCSDVKMDFSYKGYGDYQITMFCPEAAIFRGAGDGSIGSDWHTTMLYKEKVVGYDNPAEMYQELANVGVFQANHAYTAGDKIVHDRKQYSATSNFTSGTTFNVANWTDDDVDGANHGIEWSTGGRSAPVDYLGDFYYYPEIIVNGPLINPNFYHIETKKSFSLGHDPDTVCKISVSSIQPSNGVANLGNYVVFGVSDASYPLGIVSTSGQEAEHGNYRIVGGSGTGLTVSFKPGDSTGIYISPLYGNEYYGWTNVSSLNITNAGSGYEVGDYVELNASSLTNITQPPIAKVTAVNGNTGITSLAICTYGHFATAATAAAFTLTSLSGEGTGATVTVNIQEYGTSVTGGFKTTNCTLEDGGGGYEVGDTIYVIGGMQALEYEVQSVASGGAITGLSISTQGTYASDYTAKRVTLLNAGTSTGTGAKANITMEQDSSGNWYLSGVQVPTGEGGTGYKVGDILTPYIVGDSIFSISRNQTLVIDMHNRSVMVDGSSRSFYINPGSEWFSMQPNQINHIIFTSDGENDVQTARIRWRNAYQGI